MAEARLTIHEEFLDLAAAVALHAADEGDYRRVQQHADECPECGDVLRSMLEAAALMGTAVPQVDPPPALRERVLVQAEKERPRRPLPLWPRLVASARRAKVSPAWGVAVASMIVSIGALLWVATLQGQVADLQVAASAERDRAARYDRVTAVLASPQLAVRSLQPTQQAFHTYATVYLDPSSGTGMLTARGLPPVSPGHALQLWFVRGNERVSGGLVWPDRAGNCSSIISVPPDVDSFETIGVTEEPGQGSAWPTTQRILWARIADQ
jgi:hypothetical protein